MSREHAPTAAIVKRDGGAPDQEGRGMGWLKLPRLPQVDLGERMGDIVGRLLDDHLYNLNQLSVLLISLSRPDFPSRVTEEVYLLASEIPVLGSMAHGIVNFANNVGERLPLRSWWQPVFNLGKWGMETVALMVIFSRFCHWGRRSDFWPVQVVAGVASGFFAYQAFTEAVNNLLPQVSNWPLLGEAARSTLSLPYIHTLPPALGVFAFMAGGGWSAFRKLNSINSRK